MLLCFVLRKEKWEAWSWLFSFVASLFELLWLVSVIPIWKRLRTIGLGLLENLSVLMEKAGKLLVSNSIRRFPEHWLHVSLHSSGTCSQLQGGWEEISHGACIFWHQERDLAGCCQRRGAFSACTTFICPHSTVRSRPATSPLQSGSVVTSIATDRFFLLSFLFVDSGW